MTHITCRLTAKNRDQLRNSTLGNRVRVTSPFFTLTHQNSTALIVLPGPSLPVEHEFISVDARFQSADRTFGIVSLLIYNTHRLIRCLRCLPTCPKDASFKHSFYLIKCVDLRNAQALCLCIWLGTITFITYVRMYVCICNVSAIKHFMGIMALHKLSYCTVL